MRWVGTTVGMQVVIYNETNVDIYYKDPSKASQLVGSLFSPQRPHPPNPTLTWYRRHPILVVMWFNSGAGVVVSGCDRGYPSHSGRALVFVDISVLAVHGSCCCPGWGSCSLC